MASHTEHSRFSLPPRLYRHADCASHLPHDPSAVLLLSSPTVLHTSRKIDSLLSRSLLRPIAFFGPLALACILALLSTLSSDSWTSYSTHLSPSTIPPETRLMLLVLLISATAGYLLIAASPPLDQPWMTCSKYWDRRQGADAQLEATASPYAQTARALIRAQLAYTYIPSAPFALACSTCRLPAPLNLSKVVGVDFPGAVMTLSPLRRRVRAWRMQVKTGGGRSGVVVLGGVVRLWERMWGVKESVRGGGL